jgi:hypothetical protein
MAKITINDKELDTDNFNEEQNKAYAEIKLAAELQNNHQYQLELLKQRIAALAQFIAAQEETEESDG